MKRSIKLALVLLSVCLVTVLGGLLMLDDSASVRALALGSDRVLLSADGQLLQTLRTDFKKRRLAWSPLKAFPKVLQDFIILAEDQRFHSHPGFDALALARAARAILSGQRVQGASTITMQVADLTRKDVLVENRPIRKGSVVHKALQIIRAVQIELMWSKAEILEAYLNLIHLRGEFQGVPALSYAFLNKDPLALSASESAVIAAMISAPNQGSTSLKRRGCLLHRRQSVGDESCANIDAAVDALFARAPHMPASPGIAPHLARRIFKENPDSSILTSTIDVGLQRQVIAILDKNLPPACTSFSVYGVCQSSEALFHLEMCAGSVQNCHTFSTDAFTVFSTVITVN